MKYMCSSETTSQNTGFSILSENEHYDGRICVLKKNMSSSMYKYTFCLIIGVLIYVLKSTIVFCVWNLKNM